ncbi:hypothetical protein J6590_011042 [Homalodisca vitripennis]|nr:hypothetical protein J6590_011042 [Homalodisca vitripennis]
MPVRCRWVMKCVWVGDRPALPPRAAAARTGGRTNASPTGRQSRPPHFVPSTSSAGGPIIILYSTQLFVATPNKILVHFCVGRFLHFRPETNNSNSGGLGGRESCHDVCLAKGLLTLPSIFIYSFISNCPSTQSNSGDGLFTPASLRPPSPPLSCRNQNKQLITAVDGNRSLHTFQEGVLVDLAPFFPENSHQRFVGLVLRSSCLLCRSVYGEAGVNENGVTVKSEWNRREQVKVWCGVVYVCTNWQAAVTHRCCQIGARTGNSARPSVSAFTLLIKPDCRSRCRAPSTLSRYIML